MNDEELRSELERRANSASPGPDWAKRVVVPAVWHESDARPSPVISASWAPGRLSVAAVVVALLLLVVAIPRMVSQPPLATGSPSVSEPLPSAPPVRIACPAADGPGFILEVVDKTGFVASCQSLDVPFRSGPSDPEVTNPDGAGTRLRVTWGTSACADRASVSVSGSPAHFIVGIAQELVAPSCEGPEVFRGFELDLSDDVAALNVAVFFSDFLLTHQPSPTPSPTADQELICAGSEARGDPGVTLIDHTGSVDDCAMAVPEGTGTSPVEVTQARSPGRIAVEWADDLGCPGEVSIEFWGPLRQPLGLDDYVLRLQHGSGQSGLLPGEICNDILIARRLEFASAVSSSRIHVVVNSSTPNTVWDTESASTGSGLFKLALLAPAHVDSESPFDVASTLTNAGTQSVRLSGSWVPDFDVRSLSGDGPTIQGYGSDLMCPDGEATLDPGESVSGELVHPPSRIAGDPNNAYFDEHPYDGHLYLPTGDYLISAGVGFNVGSHCQGEHVYSIAQIVLHVGSRSPTTEPSPTPSPSTADAQTIACGFDGLSPINFIDHSGLIASCAFDSAATYTSDVAVTRSIVGDERHLIVTWPSSSCSANTNLELWGPLTHSEVSDSYPHYVLDVERLPFTGGGCMHGVPPDQRVDLLLKADVLANDVEAFVSVVEDDAGKNGQSTVSAPAASGRFVLVFGGRIGDWSAGEPVHVSARVLYLEGRDKVTVIGQAAPEFGFEQVDGSLEIPPPPTTLMCPADHQVVFQRDVAQTTDFHLFQGAGTEQYSAYFEQYGYDDQFRLPAGTYRLYALVDLFVGDNCQGEHVSLKASVVITVH